MAPDSTKHHASFPYLEYPVLRDTAPKSPHQWLKGKRLQDGAEGLWRIHDQLYDLSSFISSHPGGKQWIECTKGTDITEQFETHHLHGKAEELLPKYFVRKATTARNSPFTFQPDGFYRTLKEKVINELKNVSPESRMKSDLIFDVLIFATIFSVGLCCWLWKKNMVLGILMTVPTGMVLSSLATAAHNYFHRADNWRMYVFNISGLSYADWRISHGMSHHLHTNTLQDLEISMLEPFLYYTPYKNKPIWAQLGAIYAIILFPTFNTGILIKEMISGIFNIEGKKFDWSNLLQFSIPLFMYFIGGLSFLSALFLWLVLMLTYGFFFVFYGLTAGHHGHENFFDGDIPRGQKLDWGIHQLHAIVEKTDNMGNHFFSLTRFGDHTLHHLFPTLDHAELSFLYPTFVKHCEKYDVEFRTQNGYQALISNAKQIIRNKPLDFRK